MMNGINSRSDSRYVYIVICILVLVVICSIVIVYYMPSSYYRYIWQKIIPFPKQESVGQGNDEPKQVNKVEPVILDKNTYMLNPYKPVNYLLDKNFVLLGENDTNIDILENVKYKQVGKREYLEKLYHSKPLLDSNPDTIIVY